MFTNRCSIHTGTGGSPPAARGSARLVHRAVTTAAPDQTVRPEANRRATGPPNEETTYMLLRVDIEDRADHAVVTAAGEIDAATADTVADAVTGALADGYQQVLLDFARVTFIDSTGLGVLVKSHRAAESAGARFAVVHPTPQTRKLIRVLGLDQLLHIYDSHEQALADR